ncbi:Dynactin subunit 1 [Labeo rohita]|uniref:Dynactin subunit 1 n=1 Tax=Labeo rohita TaxID=84645 RepID=A0ABQ8L6M7_LABRO|nr:Dynactin subunit 1 [Labeo rohita]
MAAEKAILFVLFEEFSEPDEIRINMCLILQNTPDVTVAALTIQRKREHPSRVKGFVETVETCCSTRKPQQNFAHQFELELAPVLTICAVGSPWICPSPAPLVLGLEDPSTPPPDSEAQTPPQSCDPAAPPWLPAPSSPLESVIIPLPPPRDCTLLSASRLFIPLAPSGSTYVLSRSTAAFRISAYASVAEATCSTLAL